MNKGMFFLAVCLMASSLLSACAEKWQKPGASQQDFETMKSTCESRSLARFSVMLRLAQSETERTTPMATRCSGAGASLRCSTVGGQYMPPTVTSVDDNKPARDEAARKCLVENGWRIMGEK